MAIFRMPAVLLLFVSASALASALVTPAARAADFRVENTVLIDGQSQPQSQGVTIFHEGNVYDFLNDPAEVIVFEKAQGRFVLLDIGRRLRSEISTARVQHIVDLVQQSLAARPDAKNKWLADPTFDESLDRKNSELTLKSDALSYRARLQTADAATAAEYREFADWYAKLNNALNPKSRPPFPRMKLNEAIERQQAVTKEVHLTAAFGPNEPTLKVTSRHQLSAPLTAADTKRLAEVGDYQQTFTSVSLLEYRKSK